MCYYSKRGTTGRTRMLGSHLQSTRGDVRVRGAGRGGDTAAASDDGGDVDAERGDSGDAQGVINAESGDTDSVEAVVDDCRAEEVHLFERLITAHISGTFHPTFSDITVDNPVMIAIGDEIGVLVQSGEKHTVVSPFTGLLMGLMALPGERVQVHQPLAWLTTDDSLLWD
jgi:hypothetical protein